MLLRRPASCGLSGEPLAAMSARSRTHRTQRRAKESVLAIGGSGMILSECGRQRSNARLFHGESSAIAITDFRCTERDNREIDSRQFKTDLPISKLGPAPLPNPLCNLLILKIGAYTPISNHLLFKSLTRLGPRNSAQGTPLFPAIYARAAIWPFVSRTVMICPLAMFGSCSTCPLGQSTSIGSALFFHPLPNIITNSFCERIARTRLHGDPRLVASRADTDHRARRPPRPHC